MAVRKFSIFQNINQTGPISSSAYDVSGLDKVRFVIEGANAGNEITVRVKIKGQSSYSTLGTITGNEQKVFSVRTYDLMEVDCTTYDATDLKIIGVGFKLEGTSNVPEYNGVADFPLATGTGDLVWDSNTNTLYYDNPTTSEWRSVVSSGAVSLTETFIAFGGAGDNLTGEANFTYTAGTDTLNIINLNLNNTTVIDGVLDEDDMVSNSPTKVPTQQSVVSFLSNQTAGKLYTPEEVRVITNAEFLNKQLTLSETPTIPQATRLFVQGGPPAVYGDDFTVSGNILSWSGLGLDGLLDENDKVFITYN